MEKPEEGSRSWRDPISVPPRLGSIYPAPFGEPLAGREKRALGDPLKLTQFGVNLVTLAPGSWSSQRHWHANEDEFVYVLEGQVTLVTDAGEQVLGPGMAAGFPAGEADGHHLINQSDKPALYLEVGTRAENEEAQYSDIDMMVRKEGRPFRLHAQERRALPMRLLHRAAKAPLLGAIAALSLDDLAPPRRELPAPALLLGLCERGHRQEWSVEGRLARSVAPLPLPPLGKPRLRPRPRRAGRTPPLCALALWKMAFVSR